MINNKFVKIAVVVVIVLIIEGIFIIKKVNDSNNPKVDININGSEEIIGNKKVVKMINFVAEGCGPCKQMEVLMKELKQEYKDSVEILELDVYDYPDLAQKYNIMYTPTQMFLDSNGGVIESHTGFLGKLKIKDIIKKYNGENINGNTK